MLYLNSSNLLKMKLILIHLKSSCPWKFYYDKIKQQGIPVIKTIRNYLLKVLIKQEKLSSGPFQSVEDEPLYLPHSHGNCSKEPGSYFQLPE